MRCWSGRGRAAGAGRACAHGAGRRAAASARSSTWRAGAEGQRFDVGRPGLDAAGNAAVSWVVDDQTVELRALPASGAPGPVVAVATTGPATFKPQTIAGGGAHVLVVWRDDGVRDTLRARLASAVTGATGPIVDVWLGRSARDRVLRGSIAAAVAANGDALLTRANSPRRKRGGVDLPLARTLSADGRLGPLVGLAARGPAPWQRPALAPTGQGVVAWRAGRERRLRARTLSLDGLAAAVEIAEPDRSAVADVAIADDGTAVFAWTEHSRVWTRALTAAGRLGARVRIVGAGRVRADAGLRLAAGRGSVVLWQSGRRATVRAAHDPAPS